MSERETEASVTGTLVNRKRLALNRYVFLALIAAHLALAWRYWPLYYEVDYEVGRMKFHMLALVTVVVGSLCLYVGAGLLATKRPVGGPLFAAALLCLGVSTILWSEVYGRLVTPSFGAVLAVHGWLLVRLAARADSR
jgi:hypothetical protein